MLFVTWIVMRKNTPILTKSERLALENGYRNSNSHCYRQRCQLG